MTYFFRANPRWVDSISEIPAGPLFVIAHEFFDAMPIRQFRRAEAGWEEVTVGLRADGGLQFGVAPATPLGALSHRLDDTRRGQDVALLRRRLPSLVTLEFHD